MSRANDLVSGRRPAPGHRTASVSRETLSASKPGGLAGRRRFRGQRLVSGPRPAPRRPPATFHVKRSGATRTRTVAPARRCLACHRPLMSAAAGARDAAGNVSRETLEQHGGGPSRRPADASRATAPNAQPRPAPRDAAGNISRQTPSAWPKPGADDGFLDNVHVNGPIRTEGVVQTGRADVSRETVSLIRRPSPRPGANAPSGKRPPQRRGQSTPD
jgi:hypothetical protein